MIAPFLVELEQLVELRLEIVHGLIAVLGGGGVLVDLGRRLGRVVLVRGVRSLLLRGVHVLHLRR